MPCIGCGRGLHFECENGDCDKCHAENDQLIRTFTGKRGVGQPLKDPEKVTDPYSTGRKRAATQYPLFKTNPCEWRGKKNCGGGEPIIGCVKGLQQDRHHGPIKNPLRNEPGNVHRICKNCVSADTRLLTENLEWIKAKDLKIGEKLIGFTEDKIPFKRTSHSTYGARQTVFESSVIEAIEIVQKKSSRLLMANGTSLISSNDHYWVSSTQADAHLLWRTTDQISMYDTINYLVDPWVIDESWLSGWLAGYLDGEGCLSGYHLSVGQKRGYISNLSSELLNNLMKGKLHYTYKPRQQKHHQDVDIFRVTNVPDILTILGTVRPYRLLEKIPEYLYGQSALLGRASRKVKVLSKEDIGLQELYSIQTSSKTFIAEGFFSHNCHSRWHAVNDPIYDEMKYENLPHRPELADEIELLANEAKWRMNK